MDLDKKVNDLGLWMESKIPASDKGPGIAQGFVTATLDFCCRVDGNYWSYR